MATPMMLQYNSIKEQYPDCILFYRMGDFYELFGDDAIISSRILGITLTKRNSTKEDSPELCGFPFHAAERYIPKMIARGYKVAICEQIEDPKLAKGIVKRDVIEVITPGTAMNESNLDVKNNHYLVAICPSAVNNAEWGMAVLDISTGSFTASLAKQELIENELWRLSPREILIESSQQEFLSPLLELLTQQEKIPVSLTDWTSLKGESAEKLLLRQFKSETLESYGLSQKTLAIEASAGVLAYAVEQKKTQLDYIDRIQFVPLNHYMTLDSQTLRNLELIKPLNGDDEQSTLVHVLDMTVTAMGARKIRQWMTHPLLHKPKIDERLSAIQELIDLAILRDDLKSNLREVHDLERLMARVGSGRAHARDLMSLGRSLVKVSHVARLIQQTHSTFFARLEIDADSLLQKGEWICSRFLDDLPLTLRDGGMIRPGSHPALDELNEGIREARDWIATLEQSERTRTGISSLKVSFNKVFGYFIEVTRMHLDKVPEDYIRKQTVSTGERYITPQMKEYEARILNAEGQIHELEYKIFGEIRDIVAAWASDLREISESIAQIDALLSLALASRKHNLVRPEIFEDGRLQIEAGFHPVIAANNPEYPFICNDVNMHTSTLQQMLITGPNMAGKSTYLRQTGLIVLMAQMGCFVPASSAQIGLVDRIFTRVGASDRLARGQSTFMVEMVETANILHHASPQSLILLDEIGRGTSTFDGLSLAWSIVEYLHNNAQICGKTLFATHYHELTELANKLDRVENFHITVKEDQGKLVFLRKIVPGACDSSYGIQVAQMAGIPKEVVVRAKKILKNLEAQKSTPFSMRDEVIHVQEDLFAGPSVTDEEHFLLDELRKLHVENLTPMQALNWLFEAKSIYLKQK
jgi:DNA mismatch repair protein MutS